MKTRKAKWTRGPISTAEVVLYDDVKAEKEIDAEDQANVSLIAAAFNAATALEDQSYDGLEAIKALLEIVEVLTRTVLALGSLPHKLARQEFLALNQARALLARLKGGSENG